MSALRAQKIEIDNRKKDGSAVSCQLPVVSVCGLLSAISCQLSVVSCQPVCRLWSGGQRSFMKVSLFITCLVDQFFPQIGISTMKILRKLGVEVEFDSRQTCCGQPAFNTGYVEEARQVAQHFFRSVSGLESYCGPVRFLQHHDQGFLPQAFC